MVKQQVDDVCVSLLRGLMERCVTILQKWREVSPSRQSNDSTPRQWTYNTLSDTYAQIFQKHTHKRLPWSLRWPSPDFSSGNWPSSRCHSDRPHGEGCIPADDTENYHSQIVISKEMNVKMSVEQEDSDHCMAWLLIQTEVYRITATVPVSTFAFWPSLDLTFDETFLATVLLDGKDKNEYLALRRWKICLVFQTQPQPFIPLCSSFVIWL